VTLFCISILLTHVDSFGCSVTCWDDSNEFETTRNAAKIIVLNSRCAGRDTNRTSPIHRSFGFLRVDVTRIYYMHIDSWCLCVERAGTLFIIFQKCVIYEVPIWLCFGKENAVFKIL
jgi:hypothetical protein